MEVVNPFAVEVTGNLPVKRFSLPKGDNPHMKDLPIVIYVEQGSTVASRSCG